MFRALPLVPLEKVEAFFNALVNSALFKQPYSNDPKKYKKIKDGKYETEEIFREKLQQFAIYMRVSIISYIRIFSNLTARLCLAQLGFAFVLLYF